MRLSHETLESRRLLAAELDRSFLGATFAEIHAPQYQSAEVGGNIAGQLPAEDYESDPRLIGFFHGPLLPGRPVPQVQGVAAAVSDDDLADGGPVDGLLNEETEDNDGDGGPEQADFPFEDTFKLHSRPDSNFTIYLDFDGHTTVGTTWNSGYGLPEIVHPNYWGTFDNNFSNSRLTLIQDIWKIVAEDFAPFDVNITTEEPLDIEDLRRSGSGDARWGSRVVLTKDTFASCGCGGHAYLGSFDDPQDEPALVYNGGLNAGSETVSHEVGHQLGLNHDGVGSTTYYRGHGSGATGWGPIMGAPFSKKITQWSNQTYFNASNTGQDDLAVITGNANFPYLNDDHSNDRLLATPLEESSLTSVSAFGIIERNDDVDWFEFQTGGGTVSIDVDVLGNKPNLDVWAGIYDDSGTLVSESNPQTALNASFASLALDAGQYFIKIDGVARDGVYDATTDTVVEPDPPPYAVANPVGYSDYGSLGQYVISGTLVDRGIPTVSIAADTDAVLEGNNATFTVTTDDSANASVVVAVRDTRQTAPGVPAPNSTETVDFFGSTTQTINLVNGTGTFTIGLSADSIVEPTEYFEVEIVDPAGYAIANRVAGTEVLESLTSAGVTAIDADTVEGDTAVGNTHEFRIDRIGKVDFSQDISWRRIASGGNPAGGDDFVSLDTGVISFSPDQMSATLEVQIAGDIESESNETYAIELFDPTGTSYLIEPGRASAIGTIRDDESTIDLTESTQFRFRQVAFSRGNFDHWAIDNFAISGTTLADDFDPDVDSATWATVEGAVTNDLFPESDGNALFFNSADSRQAISIDVAPPTGSEITFDLIFADANGGGLNATEPGEDVVLEYRTGPDQWVEILRFDESEYIAWTEITVPLPEEATFAPTEFMETDSGTNTQSIPIGRSGYIDKAISVAWSITPIGDSPVSADDFVGGLPSGVLNFTAGESTATIDLDILGDTSVEPDETFRLTLTSNDGGPLLSGTLNGKILNDDFPQPEIEVSGLNGVALVDGASSPSPADGTDFGLIDVQTGSQSRTFAITNTGNADLNVSAVNVVGDGASDFSVTGTPPAAIAPGESGTFEITFTATSSGVSSATVEIVSDDIDEATFDFAITAAASDLQVESVQVNEDPLDVSRSQLTSVKVTFSEPVDETELAEAFELVRIDDGLVIETVQVASTQIDGKTETVLTFGSGDGVQDRVGTGTLGNSLENGNYRLTILGTAVRSPIDGSIHMVGNHVFGGQVAADPDNDDFFRWYGDQNGDGAINGIDINGFRDLLLVPGSYETGMDVNGDGAINGIDINSFRDAISGPSRP